MTFWEAFGIVPSILFCPLIVVVGSGIAVGYLWFRTHAWVDSFWSGWGRLLWLIPAAVTYLWLTLAIWIVVFVSLNPLQWGIPA